MLPYIEFFGKMIPTYWLWGLLGCAAAVLYARFSNRRGRAHIPQQDLFHLIVLSIAGALLGAKLLYLFTILPALIENWAYFAGNPTLLYEVLLNGMVFYGGMLGGVAAAIWYCWRYAVSIPDAAAVMVPAIPLAHAFGRVGCFFAGCCWGVEVPWGISFTHAVGAPNHVPLFPVQLVEAACNIAIFLALAVLSQKPARKWVVLPAYALLYGLVRFVLEFFRGDAIRGVALLSTSQWISLALCIAAAVVLLWNRNQKHTKPPWDTPVK